MASKSLPECALALAIMPSTWRTVRLRTTYPILRRSRCLVATATFPLLYNLIVLSLDRQVNFTIPSQSWLSSQMTEGFPWDTAPRYLAEGFETDRTIRHSAIAFERRQSRSSSLPAIILSEPLRRASHPLNTP